MLFLVSAVCNIEVDYENTSRPTYQGHTDVRGFVFIISVTSLLPPAHPSVTRPETRGWSVCMFAPTNNKGIKVWWTNEFQTPPDLPPQPSSTSAASHRPQPPSMSKFKSEHLTTTTACQVFARQSPGYRGRRLSSRAHILVYGWIA